MAGRGTGVGRDGGEANRRVLLGVLFMCAATGVLFPLMSATGKLLGAGYPSVQIAWARAFGHVVFMLVAFLPHHGPALLRTRRPRLQLLRSAVLFTSNLCFFTAIAFVPVADAAAVSLTAPLVVALLAWPMLGERTTPARLAASVAGFAGVLVVIRPGGAVFHWASLLLLGSATAYGIYQLLTRRVAGDDGPATSAIYSSVVGAFGTLLVVPFVWKAPAGPADAALFLALGTLGALGHYCVARALTYAPANQVSPFQYIQLLGAVAVGYLIFGHLPDGPTWFGAAIIAGSGLYLAWSQARPAGRAAAGEVPRREVPDALPPRA